MSLSYTAVQRRFLPFAGPRRKFAAAMQENYIAAGLMCPWNSVWGEQRFVSDPVAVCLPDLQVLASI